MTAAAIVDVELTPEQLLYRAEKARRVGRVRPELVAAAAVLQRLDDEAREARNGGRPAKNISVGKAKIPRARLVEFGDEMPGRPEWLTPPTPPKEPGPLPAPARLPTPSTPMTYEKTCKRSGRAFTSTAKTTQFCHECDKCIAADGETPAPKPTKAKKEKKRKPINTGFHRESPRSTRAAKSSGVSPAIAHLDEKIAALDTRREELVELRTKLQELEAE